MILPTLHFLDSISFGPIVTNKYKLITPHPSAGSWKQTVKTILPSPALPEIREEEDIAK